MHVLLPGSFCTAFSIFSTFAAWADAIAPGDRKGSRGPRQAAASPARLESRPRCVLPSSRVVLSRVRFFCHSSFRSACDTDKSPHATPKSPVPAESCGGSQDARRNSGRAARASRLSRRPARAPGARLSLHSIASSSVRPWWCSPDRLVRRCSVRVVDELLLGGSRGSRPVALPRVSLDAGGSQQRSHGERLRVQPACVDE